MPFRYNSQDAVQTFDAGEYQARIEFVSEEKSKSGNDMLKVRVGVYNSDRRKITVTDYIVAPSTVWKLEQIAVALGEREEFEANRFDLTQYMNANVTVRLVVEESAKYGKQNKISNYSAAKGGAPMASVAVAEDDDEEVPF